MNSFEKVVVKLEEQNNCCNSFIEELVELGKENIKWFLDFEKDCKALVEGSQSQFKPKYLTIISKTPKTRPRRGRKRLSPETSQESQENQNSTCEKSNDFKRPRTSDKSENADQEICGEKRAKRTASKKAAEQITRNMSMKLNQKFRRNANGDLEVVVIKQEKVDTVISSVLKDITNTETVEITENSQKEVVKHSSRKEKDCDASSSSESTQFRNDSEMPPPAKLPPKKHIRQTKVSKQSDSDDDNSSSIKKSNKDKNSIVNIKKERDDYESMPPPRRTTRTVRKCKKEDFVTLPVTKSKRTKAKKHQQDDDSLEVQIIQPKISTVELYDSDDDVPLVHRFKDNIQFLAVKIKKERISKETNNHNGNSADENTEDKSLSEASEKTKPRRSRSCNKNTENNTDEYLNNEKSTQEAYEKSRPAKRSRSANDALNQKKLEINHNTETLTTLSKSLSNGTNESPIIMDKTVTINNTNNFQSSTPAAISEISTDNANKTVVLSQVATSVKSTASPLITDDDSDMAVDESPKKLNIKSRPPIHSKITTKSPQLFSPYANNPVKNRVAAFERIGNAELTSSDVNRPTRMTRTKTKALKEAAEHAECDKSDDARSLKSSKADVSSKNLTRNNSRTNLTSSMESLSSNKVAKASRADIREKREADQKRKMEKEEESQKKKEALLSAKIEEQKRKREEKLQRAQQQREAKEKEKQLLYEKHEKEKEERKKRLLAERDERLKEEIQRKRALAAQRAAETEERRKAEEAARLAKIKEQEEAEKMAEAQRKKELEEAEKLHQLRLEERAAEQIRQKARAHMQATIQAKKIQKIKNSGTSNTPIKTPKLPGITTPLSAKQKNYTKPTPSNLLEELKSDDSTDDEENPKKQVPLWSQKEQRNRALLKQAYVPSKMVKALFNTCRTTVNLGEIFENIDERLLRRNSSAVWRTPPRFSQMTKF